MEATYPLARIPLGWQQTILGPWVYGQGHPPAKIQKLSRSLSVVMFTDKEREVIPFAIKGYKAENHDRNFVLRSVDMFHIIRVNPNPLIVSLV